MVYCVPQSGIFGRTWGWINNVYSWVNCSFNYVLSRFIEFLTLWTLQYNWVYNLWGLRCIQDEVWQLFKHFVKCTWHVLLRKHLPRQVREETRCELSVAGLALQRKRHSQRGELIFVMPQVQLFEQHLSDKGGNRKLWKIAGMCIQCFLSNEYLKYCIIHQLWHNDAVI